LRLSPSICPTPQHAAIDTLNPQQKEVPEELLADTNENLMVEITE